jgi:tRNA modification GTPase
MTRDTIFALSSGRPPAAIAVVRISGPRARFGLETLVRRLPEPRRAALAKVRDPEGGEVIDSGLVLWFPGPRSETGEDMAELQLHGGRAVVAAVLAALGRLEGLRPAEPGEFTRRAFENGRLDLTEVEGLADLIYAETEAQRRQAFRQLSGALGERAETWRQRLIEALALVEARIDFSDEADVPADLVAPALAAAAALRSEIASALDDGRRGERLRDGFVIAIAGPPNAGKSSLLNAIARREAAIVTPFAGTTRDVIEVHLDLEGFPVTLLDTAGIRDTDDPIEQEGVRRARARAAAADLVLWVVDIREPVCAAAPPGAWVVRNKLDLVDSSAQQSEAAGPMTVSALTGAGVAELINQLVRHVRSALAGPDMLITRERHRRALQDTAAALGRAVGETAGREDLLAEELRLAARSLGRLVGRVDVDDVLDVIFRDFCIGK